MKKMYSKKILGSYSSVGVIVSITLALIVTGAFGILMIYSYGLEKLVRENIKVQVYLKTGLTETQRTQIEKKLEALEFVTKLPSAPSSVQFVSREEAAKRFIEETGEDFMKFLGENPLRDAYLVRIDPSYHTRQGMEKVRSEILRMNGVFQVFYVEELIDSVNRNVTRIGLALAGISVVLLLTVVLLINNTIRLALFSQRFLIRSMQLVGAKKWFIQRPFLFRSMGYGLLSGALASLVLALLINYGNSKIEDLALLQNNDLMIILSGMLLLFGMVVSFSSTFFSMRKYLKKSLDELY